MSDRNSPKMTPAVTYRREITDRACHQCLAGSGEASDSSSDVDGNSRQVVAAHLALSGVNTDAYIHADRPCRPCDGESTADRPGRSIERREEAVTSHLHLSPSVASQLGADAAVMLVEELMPAVVADGRGPIGRPDDVGEQQRRQHAIAAIGGRVRPGHEFLDVVDHLAGILRSPTGVEVTRQLREPCSRDRARRSPGTTRPA